MTGQVINGPCRLITALPSKNMEVHATDILTPALITRWRI